MANEMLKFRKGTHDQIMAATKVPGTIYIAKDEKAMYVDIDTTDNGRIRIGDFIRVATVEGIQPPFSTSALYYVEADNALLKYVETTVEGVTTGEWKQVNGTDDLADRMEAAEDAIAELQAALGTGTETPIADRVTAVEGRMTTAEGKITTAEGKITTLEGEMDAVEGRATAVEGRMDTAEDDIDALQELTATQGTAIEANADAIEALAGEFATHKTEATSTFATKTELANEKAALQKEIDDDVKAEADRAKLAEQANAQAAADADAKAEARVEKTVFEQFKTDNTAAINTAKNAAIESANGYTDGKITAEEKRADEKYATKLSLEATNNIVTGHGTTLETLTGGAEVAGSVAEAKAVGAAAQVTANQAVADAKAANDNAETRLLKSEFETFKTTNSGNLETVNNAIAENAADIAENAKAIAANKTAVEAAQADATQALADAKKANDAIGDANGGLVKDIADNKQAAADAQDTADAAVEAAATAQAQADKGVADAAKAQGDIDAFKEAHKDDYNNETIDAKVKAASDAAAAAQKAADDAQKDADANAEAIADLEAAVDTLNGDATTEGSVAKAVADAKTALEDKIKKDINAANAMDYKGGVSFPSDLPAEAKSGDTYVVQAAFGDYLPGDLLIATGDEDPDTGKITGPTWNHVKTGYDASLEQTIKTVDGKIQLTSAVGTGEAANNGQIEFVAAEGSSAQVTVADNKVTVGLVWEDFPEVTE